MPLIKNKYNQVLLGLFSFLFIMNLPLFFNLTTLVHDSLFYFHSFHAVYNNYFYHNEFMQWLPFTAYGVSGEITQLTLLTVVDYFMVFIGCILRVKDALLIYKVSLFLEQSIFLWGMYLLSRDLFKRKSTIIFVCVCAIGSTVILSQLYWCFLSFYLLPLGIYCLIRCFKKYDLRYLLLAMNITILGLVGAVPYYGVITLLELFIISVYLLILYGRNWKEYFCMRKMDILAVAGLLLCFIVLLSAYLYISFTLKAHVRLLSVGRDVDTYRIPLESFLNYGGHTGFGKFASFFIPELFIGMFSDLTVYIGFLAVFFVIFGIVKVRNFMFYSFFSVVIVLTMFSLGGIVSKALYYCFPGMRYYRHIGLSVGSFKVFLPLLAGFGLEAFLKQVNSKWLSISRYVIAFVLILGAVMYCSVPDHFITVRTAVVYAFILAIVILTMLSCFKEPFKKKYLRIIVLIGICTELLGYQAIVASQSHIIASGRPRGFDDVKKYEFQMERKLNPPDERSRAWFQYFNVLNSHKNNVSVFGATYTSCHNLLQWDACMPFFRIDFVNRHVASLIESKGGMIGLGGVILTGKKDLHESMGCFSSKLKLITNVTFADSEEQAIDVVRKSDNIHRNIVLTNAPEDIKAGWKNYSESRGEIRVVKFSANVLEADVDIPEESGAWLYYADGFHPKWKAVVNGRLSQVVQANVAFKAVRLNQGFSKVKFVYDNEETKFSFYILIIGGIIFVSICLYKMWCDINKESKTRGIL